jgi:DNA-binding transcriptional ArsR family regulator
MLFHQMVNSAYKAIAHPVRRTIIERLTEGSATVGQATRDLGVTKPAITKHLKVLEEAGVVSRVIDGRTHRLSLDLTPLDEASQWLELQRNRWTRLLDSLEAYVAENQKIEKGKK